MVDRALRGVVWAGVVVVAALGMAACGDVGEAELGAEDEFCYVDNDCRAGLVCAERACVLDASSDTNGGTNNTNNTATNSAFIDPTTLTQVCGGVCDRIQECSGIQDGCVDQCSDDLRANTEAEVRAFEGCVLGFSCRELPDQADVCFALLDG